MPRKKAPGKLRSLSIAAIACLLAKLNSCDLPVDFLWFMRENNPFRCFPGRFIQEILSCLGKETRNVRNTFIKKDVLRLLFCRNLDQLDLSPVRIHENDLAEVLGMIMPVASGIQSFCLFIENFGFVTKEQFNEMIRETKVEQAILQLGPIMNNVTHLYLHNICFDKYLDIIGQHCPKLVHLRAISEFITDQGLQSLCMNVNDLSDTSVRCQNLQKISLDPRAEGISAEGIKFLLAYLPQLAEVEGCLIGHVLEYTHKNDYLFSEKTYKLQHFMYDWRESQDTPSLVADIAVKMCPFISTLKLLEPNDEILQKFGSLKCLTSITIITYSNRATFRGGVLPLIQQAGKNVTKLSLTVKEIDIYAVDQFCPVLKCLDCNNVEEILESDYFTPTPFQHLEDLIFHAHSLYTLTSSSIKVVLSHCLNLQYLYISGCNNFTDELLQEIMQINPLRKLRYLHLMYVQTLSVASIELLVNQDNDLERIWLFDAAGIYRTTLRSIKAHIRDKNLDLVINDDV